MHLNRLYKTLLFGLLFSLIINGCYEDKGNYDYTQLDEVKVDTTGLNIQTSYVLDRYDSLRINPNVYFNGKPVETDSPDIPLTYMWTMYSAIVSANSDYTVDTLSYTKDLNKPITRAAGQYYVLLTITNKDNNTQEYFRVSCTIEESITAGWMALYETEEEPGKSDVALIVNPWVKKNIIKNREFYNLYKASNGAHLEGLPLHVLHTCVGVSEDEVVLVTDKEMVGVNQGTFSRTLQFEDFFYDAPTDRAPQYYGAGGNLIRSETVISNNKLYHTVFSSVFRSNFFGIPYRGSHGELASWGSNVHGTSYDAIVYDQTARNFKCVNKNAVSITPFSAQNPELPFDVNNVGAELLMGDWGRSFYDYILMRNDNNYYLAVANFNTSSISTSNIAMGWYDISESPGISEANTMAAAFLGEYILYGAGSSVYNLKYKSSNLAEIAWTAPENEKVTCVRLQKYYFQSLFLAMLPYANQILHVATWNETTKEGKLYQFMINPANGMIIDTLAEYAIPGKVYDMAWKKALE